MYQGRPASHRGAPRRAPDGTWWLGPLLREGRRHTEPIDPPRSKADSLYDTLDDEDWVEQIAEVLEEMEAQQDPVERPKLYSYDYDAGMAALKTVKKYDKAMYDTLKGFQVKGGKDWIEKAVDYESRILTAKEERAANKLSKEEARVKFLRKQHPSTCDCDYCRGK